MSLDSSKFNDPWGLNSSEDETRTQRFLTTISRDLGISSEIATNVRISDTGNLPSVFAVSDFATAAVAAAAAAIAEFVAARFGSTPQVVVSRRLSSLWFGWSVRPDAWALPAAWDPIVGDYQTADGWIRFTPTRLTIATRLYPCSESQPTNPRFRVRSPIGKRMRSRRRWLRTRVAQLRCVRWPCGFGCSDASRHPPGPGGCFAECLWLERSVAQSTRFRQPRADERRNRRRWNEIACQGSPYAPAVSSIGPRDRIPPGGSRCSRSYAAHRRRPGFRSTSVAGSHGTTVGQRARGDSDWRSRARCRGRLVGTHRNDGVRASPSTAVPADDRGYADALGSTGSEAGQFRAGVAAVKPWRKASSYPLRGDGCSSA
jgi:hypothetical protein